MHVFYPNSALTLYQHCTCQKIIYANMGEKSFCETSTIQPTTPKLFKVHFDIFNLKNENGPISFKFSGISFLFSMCFVPDENQHQIKQNFRNMLFIYMIMTSTPQKNNICILRVFDQHYP
jgi:hypothetical protein